MQAASLQRGQRLSSGGSELPEEITPPDGQSMHAALAEKLVPRATPSFSVCNIEKTGSGLHEGKAT